MKKHFTFRLFVNTIWVKTKSDLEGPRGKDGLRVQVVTATPQNTNIEMLPSQNISTMPVQVSGNFCFLLKYTSLAAPGALAHRLQRLSACLI